MNIFKFFEYADFAPTKIFTDKLLNDTIFLNDRVMYHNNYIVIDDFVLSFFPNYVLYALNNLFVLITYEMIGIFYDNKLHNIAISNFSNMESFKVGNYLVNFNEQRMHLHTLTVFKVYQGFKNMYTYEFKVNSTDNLYEVKSQNLIFHIFSCDKFIYHHDYDNRDNIFNFSKLENNNIYVSKIEYIDKIIKTVSLRYNINSREYITTSLVLNKQGQIKVINFDYTYLHKVSATSKNIYANIIATIEIVIYDDILEISITELKNDYIIQHSNFINDARYRVIEKKESYVNEIRYKTTTKYPLDHIINTELVINPLNMLFLYNFILQFYKLPELNRN